MQNDLFSAEYFNIFSYGVQKNTNKATGALVQVCFPMPPDGTMKFIDGSFAYSKWYSHMS